VCDDERAVHQQLCEIGAVRLIVWLREHHLRAGA
jgi:hypothetical protein